MPTKTSSLEQTDYTVKTHSWKGWYDIANGLYNYLIQLRQDHILHRWCGEYVSPLFISNAARIYPELHTVEVYRRSDGKQQLKAFAIWADGCAIEVNFKDSLFIRKEDDPRYHLRLSDISEIMAWCVGEHRAGLLALDHMRDTAPGRTLMTESHDPRMQKLYRDAGFEPVYIRSMTKHNVRWKLYEDTLALV